MVKNVSRYLSPMNKTFINLIGDSQEKTARNKLFYQTKRECDLLARSNQMISMSSDVLHGNLSQRKREQALANFRQGNIRVLITTDVSARGLDIPQVDLVILTSPPQDWESYVHRSGRTGRAGRQGKSICIYNKDQFKELKLVQRNANIQFTNIHPESLNSSEEQIPIKKQMMN